jgi:transmembrane sensor
MMKEKSTFEELLIAYLADELLAEQEERFFMLLHKEENQFLLSQYLAEDFEKGVTTGPSIRQQRLQEMEQALLARSVPPAAKIFWMQKKWVTVAASVLLIVGAGLVHWLISNQYVQHPNSTDTWVEAPTHNRAVLELENGEKVFLDGSEKGMIHQSDQIQLVKLADGKVSYQQVEGTRMDEQAMHHLRNPKGSQVIQVELTDGTKVWLNAGSSISYPAHFGKTERRIEVKGEAYFEVAHEANRPMIVQRGDVDIRVLGTSFNVQAYEQDQNGSVALLEGKVRVSKGSDGKSAMEQILLPGQQVKWNRNRNQMDLSEADWSQVLAWKEGRFSFENRTFAQAMEEIERWYDVEVIYVNDVPNMIFFGDMDRKTSLNGLIKTLEILGMKANIADKRLTIDYVKQQ